MINSTNVAAQTVTIAGNVLFSTDRVKTNACNPGGSVQHEAGSGLFSLTKPGIYEVQFNANVTSATAGALAFVIRTNGEAIGGTEMDATITANSYQNISAATLVRVPCGSTKTVAVTNISVALSASVKDANIVIKRLA